MTRKSFVFALAGAVVGRASELGDKQKAGEVLESAARLLKAALACRFPEEITAGQQVLSGRGERPFRGKAFAYAPAAGEGLELVTNTLAPFFVGKPVLVDAAGPIFRAPVYVGKWQGFQCWRPEAKGRVVAAVTKSNRPLFVPVAKERILRANAARLRRGGSLVPAEMLERQLAAMSESERSGEYVAGDGVKLVAPNPRLLESGAPELGCQLMALSATSVEEGSLEHLTQQLDVPLLRQMLV